MVKFFSPVSFSEKQSEIFGQRQPGTGQWFIDSPTFQDWIRSPGATLWCPGAPGCGKTFIASIVVDYLQGLVKEERETGLTYVYCDFRRRIQEPTALLANIWTQLILQRDLSKTEVEHLEEDLYARRVKLSAAQINGLVEKEFTDGKFHRMFVVIDALDECNEAQREALLDHVSRLYPWANVLITSRVLGSDLERFTDVRVLRVISADVDMQAYIRTRITNSRKLAENVKRRKDLESEIVRVVSERAQGLFLLCKLHMDSLALESTPRAVRKVLENIPVGDTAMKDTYDNAVQRIESQHQSNREWAIRTIQWICFAMRPLTSTELTHALAVDQDDTELSEDNIVSTDLLVEYCGGLVVIEPESKIVRFVHFTTQEYFEAEKNTPLFAGTDGSIALTCITFLIFDDPFLNDEATLPELKDVQNATPFLEYATTYFGKHYHKMLSHPDSADTELAQDITDAMVKFFSSPVKVHRAAVSALYTVLGRWQVWPGGHHPVGNLDVSAIDLGAFYGVLMPNDTDAGDTLDSGDIPLTIQWFKRHTQKLTGENRQFFGNALHWAALGDSVESMKLLFQDSSLNLDTQETNTWAVKPAHVSAVFGSVGTLQILLEHSELDATSRVGDNLNWTGTILHLAIRSVGSISVAEKIALIDVIVEKDVDGKLISGYDIYWANPLIVAVKESEYPVFQRVLNYFDAVAGDSIWKDRLTADRFSKTPLHWAVMDPSFGHKNKTVATDSGPLLKLKALLDHPLAWQLMWMRDNKADVPFEEAVRQSNIHAVKYMITKAAEHQWPMFDQLLMSGLYLAVEVAHSTVVELLLSKVGPELLARPDQDTTVLHHAASGTSHGAMKFLLQRLENINLHNIQDR
ncbi:ankyrin repeat-containing domain protein, partial [Xylaria flabelliformis]